MVSNWIGIDFAHDCAAHGIPLGAGPPATQPTPSRTVVPSVGNSPVGSTTTGSPGSPPTGMPSSFFKGISSALSTSGNGDFGGPSTTSLATQNEPTLSPTGIPGGISGAVRFGNKAEVRSVLFSVCLAAVLVVLVA